MKISVMFPSKWISGDDIIAAESQGKEVNLTIESVTQEKVRLEDGTDEQKWTLSFAEVKKHLILNKTNAERINDLLNVDDSDQWVGQKVRLTTEKVKAFGKIHDAVRVWTGKDRSAADRRNDLR